MKPFGGTSPFDGNVAVTAAGNIGIVPRAPDTSVNVQDAYEHLMTSLGNTFVVATLADLDQVAPADGGGRRTVNVTVRLTGVIVLPVSEEIDVTGSGAIVGEEGYRVGIVGNSPGAVISGPLVGRRFFVQQLNPGGSCMALSSLSAPISLQDIIFLGDNVGTISNVFGSWGMSNLVFDGNLTGWVVSGIVGAWRGERLIAVNSGPTFVSYVHDATMQLIVSAAYNFMASTFSISTQAHLRYSDAATYPTPTPPTSVFSIIHSSCSSASGVRVLDESAGNLTTRSLELIFEGTVGTRDSGIVGALEFIDSANPIPLVYALPNTFTVLPWTDGVASMLAAAASIERFAFVRASTGGPVDPAFPNDWALEYLGTESDIDVLATFACSVRNPGGTQDITVQMQRRPDRVSAWTSITAAALLEQQNRYQVISGRSVEAGVFPGEQFRIGASQDITVVTTEFGQVSIAVSKQ